MMMAKGATVTQCHSRTNHLSTHTFNAGMVISAVGKPKMLDHTYIKHGTIVVDVGINRDENGKLCGDVDYEDVKDIVYAITPVPGGVGPMTVAELMSNTVESWRKRA
jgi:methylenetetrahydrofolate dehydrogenase (NADP+)/methenyltetrahydrofolate cyclohydrolase